MSTTSLKINDGRKRVPVLPEVEKELKKLGFKKRLWNNVVREWYCNLHFCKGYRNYFTFSVYFNEWGDVEGGMCKLRLLKSETTLPHIKTIEDIKNAITVLKKPNS